jgi:RND superfamily putative drug exporter
MPALLSLLGESAWWLPRWLDRVLPHVDTEGHALTQGEPEPDAASTLVGTESEPVGAVR